MRLLILLFAACLFVGCKKVDNSHDIQKSYIGSDTQIVTIDGCEYILYDGYKEYAICHKGNCSNHSTK